MAVSNFKKIFITGGTGFIGQHLVKNLQKKGYKLLLLVEQKIKYPLELSGNIKVVRGNLSDIEKWIDIVKDFKPETAVHLAWQGIPDYGPETSAKNLNYGLNLVKSLAEIGCKWILAAGSCWEYGDQSGKISENTETKPISDFTKAKNSLYIEGSKIANENNMDFIWTRLFYVYGPGQKETSLIPYLISCVKEGKIPKIKSPDAKNDFIYVEDLTEAFSKLIEKYPKSNVYNIGSGKLTSVKEIIKIIYDDFNLDIQQKNAVFESTDIFSDFWADISKIKEETDWEPKTTIEEGIKKTTDSIISGKK